MALEVREVRDYDMFLRNRVRLVAFYTDGPELLRIDRIIRPSEPGDYSSDLLYSDHTTHVTARRDGTPPDPEPVLNCDPYVLDCREDVARAVYETLRAKYEGDRAPGDAQALRRDLDAERDRTDGLLRYVMDTGKATLVAALAPPTETTVMREAPRG